MGKPRVTLYLDVVSPFAYQAYYILRHSPLFQECETEYVPIFLGALLRTCNNTVPVKIANKGQYLGTQRLRIAEQYNIPQSPGMPPNFPPLTLQVQRVLAALKQSHPELIATAFDALYQALWVDNTHMKDGNEINDPQVFGPLLQKVVGAEVAKNAMERSESDEVKELLTANNDRAFQSGAFGLPWFECENGKGEKEGFWGVDHLTQVAKFLGLIGNEDGIIEGMKALL